MSTAVTNKTANDGNLERLLRDGNNHRVRLYHYPLADIVKDNAGSVRSQVRQASMRNGQAGGKVLRVYFTLPGDEYLWMGERVVVDEHGRQALDTGELSCERTRAKVQAQAHK